MTYLQGLKDGKESQQKIINGIVQLVEVWGDILTTPELKPEVRIEMVTNGIKKFIADQKDNK